MARSQNAAPGPWRAAWAAVALLLAVLAGAAIMLQGGGGGILPRRCPVAVCHCPSLAHLAAAAANGSVSSTMNGTQAQCPSCPPPDCSGSASERQTAEAGTTAASQQEAEEGRQQQQEAEEKAQQQHRKRSTPSPASAAGQAQAPLLCSGSQGVPPVADALAAAGERLWLGLRDRFAPYEQGFTLEDLIHTAGEGSQHLRRQMCRHPRATDWVAWTG